jgi:hypothetical protein
MPNAENTPTISDESFLIASDLIMLYRNNTARAEILARAMFSRTRLETWTLLSEITQCLLNAYDQILNDYPNRDEILASFQNELDRRAQT